MKAAQEAAKKFADELTPGVNLGLISFAANPTMLSSPTTNHDATKVAIDKMQVAERTATGEAIFAALQAISTVGAVIGGGDEPPPARIVLFSDGKETSPGNPDNPRGAFTAARAAKDQGIPISTIAFGTKDGTVKVDDAEVPVPVDDTTMKQVAQLSGGTSYLAQDAAAARPDLQDPAGPDRLRDGPRRRQRGLAASRGAGARHRRHLRTGDQPPAAAVVRLFCRLGRAGISRPWLRSAAHTTAMIR